MAKLKKNFEFEGKGNIWRIIPDNNGYLLVETRDTEKKQVYFSYLNLENGSTVRKNFQLEEKFWIGIEKIYNGVIIFHKFAKPDLPGHVGLFAYDVKNEKFLWKHEDLAYSFFFEEKIYCFKRGFETNKNFAADFFTGEIISEISDETEFKMLHEKAAEVEDFSDYIFPERFFQGQKADGNTGRVLNDIYQQNKIEGIVEYACYKDILLYNFHLQNKNKSYNNIFRVADLNTDKTVLEEIINKNCSKLMPDCFFIKGNQLFLLQETKKIIVYNYNK